MRPGRLLAWSVRREVWEHRHVWIAPLVLMVLAICAFSYHIVRHRETIGKLIEQGTLVWPYSIAASVVLVMGWLVAFFYSLEALNGERRDRSILFWKSMPVSDVTTVASKMLMPVVVVPSIAAAVALVTQLAMLAVHLVVFSAMGLEIEALFANVPLQRMTVIMLYGVIVHALWFAPIFAYLLLVSAWARRAVLMWALLPFIAAFAVEKIAFGTSWVSHALQFRINGAMSLAFKDVLRGPITRFAQLDPGRYFSNPNLWLGLLIAFAFLALAVQLRRRREPN